MKTTNYLMEKYLDSTIEAEERLVLGQRISKSNGLAKELAFRRELNHLQYEDNIAMLRAKLNKSAMEYLEAEPKPVFHFTSNRTKRIFYAAATVTGITLGGWAILSGGQRGYDLADIYQKNFSPYPPITIHREGGVAEFQRGFINSMALYQASRYREAATEFENLLRVNPSASTIKFYLGIAYMELKEYPKSHDLFDQVINNDPFFNEQALWYKGLCYVAQAETGKAMECFTMLSKLNSPYSAKAEKMLKKLK